MMRDEIFTFESFINWWGLGRPNRDGQPRRPQGLWSITPPVLGARTATALESSYVACLWHVRHEAKMFLCRILGTRVYELEKKLKTLEMTGLWNVTGMWLRLIMCWFILLMCYQPILDCIYNDIKFTMRLKFGQRAFLYAAPAAWNSLPPTLQQISNTDWFKRTL